VPKSAAVGVGTEQDLGMRIEQAHGRIHPISLKTSFMINTCAGGGC
jgi:hypothetical protein